MRGCKTREANDGSRPSIALSEEEVSALLKEARVDPEAPVPPSVLPYLALPRAVSDEAYLEWMDRLGAGDPSD